MARISTYANTPAEELDGADKIIGTNEAGGQTMNFTLEDLGGFYSQTGLADAQAVFTFAVGQTQYGATDPDTYFTDTQELLPGTMWFREDTLANLNEIIVSTVTNNGTDVLPLLENIGGDVIIVNQTGVGAKEYGFFRVQGADPLHSGPVTVNGQVVGYRIRVIPEDIDHVTSGLPTGFAVLTPIGVGSFQGISDFSATAVLEASDYTGDILVTTFANDEVVLEFHIPASPGVEGPQGEPGTPGAMGDPGNDGLGWTGGSYDPSTGIITFASDDGLGFTTMDVRGSDGAPGAAGAPGSAGAPGTNGLTPVVTATAVAQGTDPETYVVTFTSDLTGQLAQFTVSDGEDGMDGSGSGTAIPTGFGTIVGSDVTITTPTGDLTRIIYDTTLDSITFESDSGGTLTTFDLSSGGASVTQGTELPASGGDEGSLFYLSAVDGTNEVGLYIRNTTTFNPADPDASWTLIGQVDTTGGGADPIALADLPATADNNDVAFINGLGGDDEGVYIYATNTWKNIANTEAVQVILTTLRDDGTNLSDPGTAIEFTDSRVTTALSTNGNGRVEVDTSGITDTHVTIVGAGVTTAFADRIILGDRLGIARGATTTTDVTLSVSDAGLLTEPDLASDTGATLVTVTDVAGVQTQGTLLVADIPDTDTHATVTGVTNSDGADQTVEATSLTFAGAAIVSVEGDDSGNITITTRDNTGGGGSTVQLQGLAALPTGDVSTTYAVGDIVALTGGGVYALGTPADALTNVVADDWNLIAEVSQVVLDDVGIVEFGGAEGDFSFVDTQVFTPTNLTIEHSDDFTFDSTEVASPIDFRIHSYANLGGISPETGTFTFNIVATADTSTAVYELGTAPVDSEFAFDEVFEIPASTLTATTSYSLQIVASAIVGASLTIQTFWSLAFDGHVQVRPATKDYLDLHYATTEQGELADSALQDGDVVDGYINADGNIVVVLPDTQVRNGVTTAADAENATISLGVNDLESFIQVGSVIQYPTISETGYEVLSITRGLIEAAPDLFTVDSVAPATTVGTEFRVFRNGTRQEIGTGGSGLTLVTEDTATSTVTVDGNLIIEDNLYISDISANDDEQQLDVSEDVADYAMSITTGNVGTSSIIDLSTTDGRAIQNALNSTGGTNLKLYIAAQNDDINQNEVVTAAVEGPFLTVFSIAEGANASLSSITFEETVEGDDPVFGTGDLVTYTWFLAELRSENSILVRSNVIFEGDVSGIVNRPERYSYASEDTIDWDEVPTSYQNTEDAYDDPFHTDRVSYRGHIVLIDEVTLDNADITDTATSHTVFTLPEAVVSRLRDPDPNTTDGLKRVGLHGVDEPGRAVGAITPNQFVNRATSDGGLLYDPDDVSGPGGTNATVDADGNTRVRIKIFYRVRDNSNEVIGINATSDFIADFLDQGNRAQMAEITDVINVALAEIAQTYDATSVLAQSGTAVAEAIAPAIEDISFQYQPTFVQVVEQHIGSGEANTFRPLLEATATAAGVFSSTNFVKLDDLPDAIPTNEDTYELNIDSFGVATWTATPAATGITGINVLETGDSSSPVSDIQNIRFVGTGVDLSVEGSGANRTAVISISQSGSAVISEEIDNVVFDIPDFDQHGLATQDVTFRVEYELSAALAADIAVVSVFVDYTDTVLGARRIAFLALPTQTSTNADFTTYRADHSVTDITFSTTVSTSFTATASITDSSGNVFTETDTEVFGPAGATRGYSSTFTVPDSLGSGRAINNTVDFSYTPNSLFTATSLVPTIVGASTTDLTPTYDPTTDIITVSSGSLTDITTGSYTVRMSGTFAETAVPSNTGPILEAMTFNVFNSYFTGVVDTDPGAAVASPYTGLTQSTEAITRGMGSSFTYTGTGATQYYLIVVHNDDLTGSEITITYPDTPGFTLVPDTYTGATHTTIVVPFNQDHTITINI